MGEHEEFFQLIVRKIYEIYFENDLKEHLEEDCCTVGIILGKTNLNDSMYSRGKFKVKAHSKNLKHVFA